ncbi:YsnF/AvaK domain-containing protein [Paraburkholderia xenovorans]|uniref:YsnF/AvaK domain-containing protein n=1 Tax=Paraburkholderia xenovorans TaxID=36873 RepID=UPI0038BBAB49
MERDPVPTPPASHVVPDGRADDELRVAAISEQLEIGVKATETGAVRVRTVVHEDVRSVPVSLRSQKVTVERTAVDRAVEQKDEPRQEGDTLIIPVYEYVPVVRMQLMLKEEIRLTTTESVERSFRDVALQSEEVVVERRKGTDGEWQREDPHQA